MKLPSLKRDETFYLMIVPLITISVLLSGSISGCGSFLRPSKTDSPAIFYWGKKGVQPDQVWNAYDWVIMSEDYYLEQCY